MIYLIAYLVIAAALLVWMARRDELKKTFHSESKANGHPLTACIFIFMALIWPALAVITFTLCVFSVKPDEIHGGMFPND